MTPLDRLSWLRAVSADQMVTIGALRVAAALTGWIGKEGSCFPSVKTIGAAVGMQERGTRKVLSQLESAGWITVARTVGRTSNVYTPKFSTRSGGAGSTGHDGTGSTRSGGAGLKIANPARRGRQPGTGTLPTRSLECRLTREQGEQGLAERIPPEGNAHGSPDEISVVGPTFALKDGSLWKITTKALANLEVAFGNVDVRATLNIAAAWCDANPLRRKKANGMARFLHNWLATESKKHPRPMPATYGAEVTRSILDDIPELSLEAREACDRVRSSLPRDEQGHPLPVYAGDHA